MITCNPVGIDFIHNPKKVSPIFLAFDVSSVSLSFENLKKHDHE